MEFSQITKNISESIFSILEDKRRNLVKQGKEVVNLSVGTPDFFPDEHVVNALSEAASRPENYGYAIKDMPELKEAAILWYKRRYGVELTHSEVTSINGSQEGLSHIFLSMVDPGDIVIIPNPSYPIFAFGALLAHAQLYYAPLLEENKFLIDFSAIPEDVAKAAKAIVVSYPNNPVTAVATDEFYRELIAFATKYDIIVLHDNAYSELVFGDGYNGSFLAYEGAKEIGVEFNSLSKSYNMTGCRISFALGNERILSEFRKVRSQIDYGVYLPIQHAAIAALNGPQNILARNRAGYRARMETLCGGLRSIGWEVPDSPATMFVWAPIPREGVTSTEFVMELLDKTGVIGVPGETFGSLGDKYIRFALTAPISTLKRAVEKIEESKILERD